MKQFFAITSAIALAALSSVVCSYFANDPATGITTGFSPGELKVIPWIVFIVAYVAISQSGKQNRTIEADSQSESTDQSARGKGKEQPEDI